MLARVRLLPTGCVLWAVYWHVALTGQSVQTWPKSLLVSVKKAQGERPTRSAPLVPCENESQRELTRHRLLAAFPMDI
jgi:hypothetical protein